MAPRLPTPAFSRSAAYIQALGGAANLLHVDACTTRLRLNVGDNNRVDEAVLKALGSKGVIRPAPGSIQVIIGPQADQLASEIQETLKATATPASSDRVLASAMLSALGGAANVREVGLCTTRLRLIVVNDALVNDAALKGLGTRGVVKPAAGSVQIILGPSAERVADELRALIA